MVFFYPFLTDCTSNETLCHSDIVNGEWHTDGGYLTDKSTLPVKSVYIEDIGEPNQVVRLRLGPLTCNGSTSEEADKVTGNMHKFFNSYRTI